MRRDWHAEYYPNDYRFMLDKILDCCGLNDDYEYVKRSSLEETIKQNKDCLAFANLEEGYLFQEFKINKLKEEIQRLKELAENDGKAGISTLQYYINEKELEDLRREYKVLIKEMDEVTRENMYLEEQDKKYRKFYRDYQQLKKKVKNNKEVYRPSLEINGILIMGKYEVKGIILRDSRCVTDGYDEDCWSLYSGNCCYKYLTSMELTDKFTKEFSEPKRFIIGKGEAYEYFKKCLRKPSERLEKEKKEAEEFIKNFVKEE